MENKIVGYKKYFGFVLPDFIDEKQINTTVGYVLVALVMTFVLLLVVNPNTDRVQVGKKQVAEEQAKLAKLKQSRDSLNKMSESIGSNTETIFKAMPLTYSPEEAIFQLRRVAVLAGVSLLEYSLPAGVILDQEKAVIATANQSAAIRFQSFPVKLTVSGSISRILDFINRVEKSLPIGFVADLNIKEITEISRKNAGQEVNLKLEVAYYQPVFLKAFNLSNLETLTQEDIELARELKTYSGVVDNFMDLTFEATVSGQSVNTNLFGL